jgi:hypothetical protein
LPFFVPQRRSVELCLRGATKNDTQSHLFKRSLMED